VVVLSMLASPLAEPDALAEPLAPCVGVPVELPLALLVLSSSPLGVFAPEAFSEPALPVEAPELSAVALDSDLTLAASWTVVEVGGLAEASGVALGDGECTIGVGTDALVAIGGLAS
jgi:hypothetical protein